MAIVFLDFDGVLLPDSSALEQSQQGLTVNNYLDQVVFGAECVINLNHILEQTHAEIVLSTSWALGHPLSELATCLDRNNIDSSRIFEYEDPSLYNYMTPRKFSSNRAQEIAWWLEDHTDISNWVALDDMQVIRRLGPRSIITDPTIGLTKTDAAKAIAILN